MTKTMIKYDSAKIQTIKEIANENINTIFEELEISTYMTDHHPKYINGPCPIHGGSNRTGFSWDYRSGFFKCWTGGCHNSGSDVFSLVSKMKNINFKQSIDWIIKTLDIDLDKLKISYDNIENIDFIRNAKPASANDQKPYSEYILKEMKPTPYLTEERGFSQEISDKYEPRVGISRIDMSMRIAFPVRNKQGKIIGFTGRKSKNKYTIPKWLHHGFNTGDNLYNINFAAENIKEKQVAIICEGPLDVFKFEEAGIHNSVALFGKSVSQNQRSMLLSSGAFSVIIAMDNDEAGILGTESIKEKLEGFFETRIFEIAEGKEDVGDMSVEEVKTQYDRIMEDLRCI